MLFSAWAIPRSARRPCDHQRLARLESGTFGPALELARERVGDDGLAHQAQRVHERTEHGPTPPARKREPLPDVAVQVHRTFRVDDVEPGALHERAQRVERIDSDVVGVVSGRLDGHEYRDRTAGRHTFAQGAEPSAIVVHVFEHVRRKHDIERTPRERLGGVFRNELEIPRGMARKPPRPARAFDRRGRDFRAGDRAASGE